ncbi:hypothetical protein ALNOE001_07000 [Candidatus Methanobinarius endosymbioticus]|uniref:Uncharacterized protein n=1 Tax=Candidatus Methanobinarius endosymbioticus TaxID=2006182 RepID=A0A366MDV1_9EURY|nr:hypothetical protein ALNOE001_07000 [Candidatus Methanobinarius endosymbioticus]
MAKKKENEDIYNGKKKDRTILPGILVLFVLIILGVSSLSFAFPEVLEPVSEILLGDSNSQNISNNSSSANSLNSTIEKSSSVNDTKSDKSIPKDYSKIEIGGIKAYIKNETNDSIIISNMTEYEYVGNDSNTANNESSDFIGNNITKLSSGNGSFFIIISNSSNNSNGINDSDASKDANNIDNPNSSDVSNSSDDLNSFIVENIDEMTDNIVENIYNDNNSINIDINMSFLDNDIRVVHYNEFVMENFTSEMIWTYFKVKNADVAVGWIGNTIDMNVIESFFNLN